MKYLFSSNQKRTNINNKVLCEDQKREKKIIIFWRKEALNEHTKNNTEYKNHSTSKIK